MREVTDRRILRAMHAVSQDLSRRRSLDDVANIAGLDSQYFCRLFREVVGIGFGAWHTAVRIAEAKRLLHTVDLSILAVALSVGYSDPTTFARAFRRLEGVSPRAFRQSLRQPCIDSATNAEISTKIAENESLSLGIFLKNPSEGTQLTPHAGQQDGPL